MIWVYAVCDRPELGLPGGRGIAQAPLDGARRESLVAVVSRHDHMPAEPALDALWAHERVVERLMADRATLPMRFGTTLPDEEALRTAITARHDGLAERLELVRGRVELGLRVAPAGGGAPEPERAPATGRDYLLGKLGAHDTTRDLYATLADRAVAACRRPPAPGELLRASFLVERRDVEPFVAAVERLRAEHPTLAPLCTGPWPAYSFVGDTEPAPTAGSAA